MKNVLYSSLLGGKFNWCTFTQTFSNWRYSEVICRWLEFL